MKARLIQQAPRRGMVVIFSINLALASSLALMQAADKTWNGLGDGVNMSSSANWMGGVAPVNNDSPFLDGSVVTATNQWFPYPNSANITT